MGRVTRFSANLGFLWTDRPLADAVRSAASAGFDAVECHWPYDEDAGAVKAALAETGSKAVPVTTASVGVAATIGSTAASVRMCWISGNVRVMRFWRSSRKGQVISAWI